MIESPTRRALSARGLRARLGAVAGAAVVLIGLCVSPAAAAPSPSPSPTPTVVFGEAEFTLAPLASGVLRPGEPLTVSVTMSNESGAATTGGTVSLAFGASPLADRAELTNWLAGDLPEDVVDVGSIEFPSVEPGSDETRGIMVDATAPALGALAPGVHPVRATLRTGDESFVSTSVVVVPEDDGATVGVGVVVPVTAGAISAGLLTSDEIAELTGPEGELTNILDAVEGTEAILAVDPALVAAIRVLGTSAPETAAQWLARLEGLPNTRFALQYGDADVASQVQAGIVPPLRVSSLQTFLAPEDFVPVAAPTPTPSPSPTVDPTAPVYPDTATLLGVGTALPGIFWPATGSAGKDVVAALGGLTVDEQQGLTLVASTSTVAGAGGGAVAARGQASDARVLVYDGAVSEELHDASTVDTIPLRGAHLAAASAYLAFALDDTDGAPVLVTVDRAQDRSRVALRTAITTALAAPSAVPVTLDALVAATPSAVDVVDVAPDEARVAAASGLLSDEEAIAQFSSVLDDPALLTEPERAEMLQLLGQAWRPERVEWGAALADHRTASAATLDSVGILRASPIQLITSGAVIPVWVHNDLPYPAQVTLFATPDDLRLRVQQTTSVVAAPESNTRVDVPVQAQLGSGDVLISFELRSPTGVLIGDPQTREVHVRAEWETIGLVIIGVFGVGFLVVGVIRTVARRRRRRADAAAEAGAEAEVSAADPSDEPGAEPTPGAERDSDSDPTPEGSTR